MSRYVFGPNALLNEVSIQRSEGGGIRAYAYTRSNAKPGELKEIKDLLTAHSMQWTPIFIAGRPTLEIRGIGKNETELLRLLHSKEAVVGSYQKKPNIGDVMPLKERFLKNTLRFSGLAYFAGDMGFVTHEWKKSFENGKLVNLPGLLAGIFYALGTPALVLFGRGDKSDFQLKDISHYMLQHLKKEGIALPKDCAMCNIASGHNDGLFHKIRNFMARYPAEVCNSLFGIAGGMMIWEGLKDYAAMRKGTRKDSMVRVISDISIGISTMLAGLVSVFVEEKAPDPSEPKKHGLARAWQFVTEKPLRLAGFLLGLSTIGHTTSTVVTYKKKKAGGGDPGSLAGRALFTTTNLTAEILMAMSSKGHGAGVKTDESLDRSVHAVMADLVYRSPKEGRDILLSKISDFLSNKKHLGGRSADIENGIRDQLKALENNPWINVAKAKPAKAEPQQAEARTKWRERAVAPPQPPATAPLMT